MHAVLNLFIDYFLVEWKRLMVQIASDVGYRRSYVRVACGSNPGETFFFVALSLHVFFFFDLLQNICTLCLRRTSLKVTLDPLSLLCLRRSLNPCLSMPAAHRPHIYVSRSFGVVLPEKCGPPGDRPSICACTCWASQTASPSYGC